MFLYRIISLLGDLWKFSLFDIQTFRHRGMIRAFAIHHPHPQDIVEFQGGWVVDLFNLPNLPGPCPPNERNSDPEDSANHEQVVHLRMRGMMPVLIPLSKYIQRKARSKGLIVSIVTLEKVCCAMRAWLSIEAVIPRVAGIMPTVPIFSPEKGKAGLFRKLPSSLRTRQRIPKRPIR